MAANEQDQIVFSPQVFIYKTGDILIGRMHSVQWLSRGVELHNRP